MDRQTKPITQLRPGEAQSKQRDLSDIELYNVNNARTNEQTSDMEKNLSRCNIVLPSIAAETEARSILHVRQPASATAIRSIVSINLVRKPGVRFANDTVVLRAARCHDRRLYCYFSATLLWNMHMVRLYSVHLQFFIAARCTLKDRDTPGRFEFFTKETASPLTVYAILTMWM